MTQLDQSRHDFAFLGGVVVGAISGALATLALTPMSGAETREKIRARANDLGPMRDKVVEMTAPAREKASGMAAPMRSKAGGLATSAQGWVATGRERAGELAAKSPLPIGKSQTTEMDVVVSDGFGAPPATPAEGARDASTVPGTPDNTPGSPA